MTIEQGQYTDCLNCEETVYISSIDNMDYEIDPRNYGIIMTFHPCECGFVTVLDYLINNRYTLRASKEASNELAGKEIWYAHESHSTIIGKEEEE